jgi:hypothetical protein
MVRNTLTPPATGSGMICHMPRRLQHVDASQATDDPWRSVCWLWRTGLPAYSTLRRRHPGGVMIAASTAIHVV